jgi:hypothetical protein
MQNNAKIMRLIMDRILVLGDFNLPKVAWLKFEDFDLTPTGIFTDLEADLIDGLIDCNIYEAAKFDSQS